MKKMLSIFAGLILLPLAYVSGQNPIISPSGEGRKHQINVPETATEYSIASYKNVDFLKTNPQQLEALGLHSDIYISNTHRGVIIISSAEPNKALKDFSRNLETNPNYYESLTKQDTLIFSSGTTPNPAFDFTKASSIRHDYNNAFNYAVDPRTGVSWSKGTHKDFIQNDVLGKPVYDLIIVISKATAK